MTPTNCGWGAQVRSATHWIAMQVVTGVRGKHSALLCAAIMLYIVSCRGLCIMIMYSKELSLRNQPLETQHWILAQFLRNWLAGSETVSF